MACAVQWPGASLRDGGRSCLHRTQSSFLSAAHTLRIGDVTPHFTASALRSSAPRIIALGTAAWSPKRVINVFEHCRASCTQTRSANSKTRSSAICNASQSKLPPVIASQGKFVATQKFLLDQFLPIGLLSAMLIGFAWPGPGIQAADAGLQTFTTTGIFVISGLNLKRGEAADALSAWGAILYGLVTILLVTPLAGLLTLQLPLHPRELALGLTVFCCMPTTLSSAISLTQAVGGNTALALLLTVTSNLLGIFTMPFVICQLLGSSTGSAVSIKPGPLLKNLLQTILVPLVAGSSVRATVPVVANWVDSNKKTLSLMSSCLLILVPWMQISRAVTSDVTVKATALAAVLAAGVALHFLFLAFNITATQLLRLGEGPDSSGTGIKRACILVGSQKTLPIAVTVLNGLAPQIGGTVGLAVIPCVISHLAQIVLDSFLVSYWLKGDSAAGTKAQSSHLKAA